MKIAPIDNGQIYGRALEILGGVEAAEASSEYHDAMSSAHIDYCCLRTITAS